MTVNTPPQPNTRASATASGAARLYLREDELDFGVELILDAAQALKAATAVPRQKRDLTWTQCRILLRLQRHASTVLNLGQGLGLTKQVLIKTLETLEARGLLSRQIDPGDARRRIVTLTREGAVLAKDAATGLRTVLAQAYRQAGGDAVAGCDAVLTAVTGADLGGGPTQ